MIRILRTLRPYSVAKPKEELLDHRKIGQIQNLFSFNDYSPGMAYFHPDGLHVLNKIKALLRSEYRKYNFEEISTPIVYSKALWEKSGHLQNYSQNMYSVVDKTEKTADRTEDHVKEGAGEEEEKGLKPMNCPAHCLMYSQTHRSYRDLPLRFADFTPLHRNELSGALTGLTRLRLFHQDDGHIFCKPSQVEEEIKKFLKMVNEIFLDVFKFKSFNVYLSTRPEKYIGNLESWEKSEQILKNSLNEFGISYKVSEGDGAFYGPKIDVHVMDSIGRSHQLSTLQLDFQLPERFNLKYVEADETYKRPVMIHRAVLGSLERFLAVWLESIQGKLPFWCSPRQVKIIPVTIKQNHYSSTLKDQLSLKYPEDPLSASYQVHIDTDFEETLSKRIRNALLYNYVLVVGEKEKSTQTIAVRQTGSQVIRQMAISDLKAELILRDLNFT